MKKYSLHILLSLCLILLGGILFQNKTRVANAFANLTTYSRTPAATSSPTFLTFGVSTSTRVVPTNGIDTLQISLQGTASSTGTNFDVLLFTSSDNIDFFPIALDPAPSVTAGAATTTVTVASSGLTRRWTPGTTATSSVAFSVTPTGAFTRVQISVGTSTDLSSRGAIFMQLGVR